jgi:hypothetical protein
VKRRRRKRRRKKKMYKKPKTEKLGRRKKEEIDISPHFVFFSFPFFHMFLLNRIALYEFINFAQFLFLHLSRMHGVLLSLHQSTVFVTKRKKKRGLT